MSYLKNATQFLIAHAYPMLDGTGDQERKPLPPNYAFKPHHRSKTVGWSHYGVMIPDLPIPHHFFSIMSVIGTSGALAFDTNHALKSSPRKNATAVMGTAATHPDQFQGYSIEQDCQFAEDGSHIQFGENIVITGQYPHYHVIARSQGFELDIQITNTDKVSWFVKTPIYDHISVLSQYRGSITYQDKTEHIEGLCTFEHAACLSPYLLRDKPLPTPLKIPLDLFTYQIINLDENTQLLLNDTRINNAKIVSKAYLRGLNQYSQSYQAEFEVLKFQDQPAISPDGISMRLPQTFRWLVTDDHGNTIITIEGEVDTAFTYGLGSGYVGGYQYQGHYQNQLIQGRGYIEYINRRI